VQAARCCGKDIIGRGRDACNVVSFAPFLTVAAQHDGRAEITRVAHKLLELPWRQRWLPALLNNFG